MGSFHVLSEPRGRPSAQWEGGNSSRRYPLADDAGSDGIPDWFLSDACVVVPGHSMSDVSDSASCLVRVVSAHASRHMVSVSMETVGAAEMGGACVCTVTAGSFEPYKPYRLEPVHGSGLCGTVSFGDAMSPWAAHGTWKPRMCLLAPEAVVRVPVGRLMRFVDDITGESASGDVRFIAHKGISVSGHSPQPGSSAYEGEVWAELSLDDDLSRAIVPPCDASSGFFDGKVRPIRSINGVRPDKYGRIALVLN